MDSLKILPTRTLLLSEEKQVWLQKSLLRSLKFPKLKIHNYAFKNNGDLTFTNTTTNWGLTVPSFSNGAVYADLDNDGDMDLIVNNINDSAFCLQEYYYGSERK